MYYIERKRVFGGLATVSNSRGPLSLFRASWEGYCIRKGTLGSSWKLCRCSYGNSSDYVVGGEGIFLRFSLKAIFRVTRGLYSGFCTFKGDAYKMLCSGM